jgi:hypothetical protein
LHCGAAYSLEDLHARYKVALEDILKAKGRTVEVGTDGASR